MCLAQHQCCDSTRFARVISMPDGLTAVIPYHPRSEVLHWCSIVQLKKQLEAVAERVALPAYSKTPPEFVEADNQKRATLAANLASVEEELRRCTL